MRSAGLDESQARIKNARRNNNNLRYADDTTLMQKWRGTKEPLDEGEKESEKADLKLNIQKIKIMASGLITSWQIDEDKNGNSDRLFSWAPKSLWMVTAAMKLKDACSLEGKQWQI